MPCLKQTITTIISTFPARHSSSRNIRQYGLLLRRLLPALQPAGELLGCPGRRLLLPLPLLLWLSQD
ncbi:hypothetical protein ACKKBF_B39585 [Auxenochlorella protothecoides x Auxenochlorella symbiontica]